MMIKIPIIPSCGNCGNIRFNDPQLATREHGSCAASRQSGHALVAARDIGCSCWCKRSKKRLETDQRRHDEVVHLVSRFNRACPRGRK